MNYLFAALLVLLSQWSQAQDIHFTNFRMAPLSFNPAFTGTFKGTYRVSAIYRDQFRSIGIDRPSVQNDGQNVSSAFPFRTPFISGEFNIVGDLLLEGDWLAGGINIVRETAGTAQIRQSVFGFNLGYHIALDKDRKNVFSIGGSYGAISRSVDDGELIFPSTLQGDPTGLPNLTAIDRNQANFEPNSSNSISLGVSYKAEIDENQDIRLGLAVSNINSPNFSLTPRDSISNNSNINNLRSRITLTGESSMVISEKVRINPAIIFQAQGGATEIAVQGIADYLLDPKSGVVLSGGLGYRVGDAAELIGGIQLKDLRVFLSYDLTLSGLRRTGGGAFEIAVGYIGRIYKQPNVKSVIFCPQL